MVTLGILVITIVLWSRGSLYIVTATYLGYAAKKNGTTASVASDIMLVAIYGYLNFTLAILLALASRFL